MPTYRKTKGTPDPVDVFVGERLRVRRSLLGMSQEKLADSIDLTFQQIQKYERGMNRISAGRLYQFSKILDVPVTYFYDGCPNLALKDVTIANDLSKAVLDRESLDIVRLYHGVEKPVQKAVRNLLNVSQKEAA